MPMKTLTIIQLTGVFCAYLFASVGLPAFALGKRLSRHRAPERFIIYFMTGNFCIMNLVFALQLLKISYPVTLILGTLILTIAGKIVADSISIRQLTEDYLKYFRRVAGGQMGHRTARYKVYGYLKSRLARLGRWLVHFLVFRFFDCALIAFFLLIMWWAYGSNLLQHFGYMESDIVIHNYWINALGDNDIFVAGVYPYGFHCVIYYLHAVFGFETFTLLRVFAFVENVMLHLMMLFVLRLCCKSRYMAYAGTILFVLGEYFRVYTYSRYYAALPQEFGIIFILPSVYFLFAFFEARRREPDVPTSRKRGRGRLSRKADKRKKKASREELETEESGIDTEAAVTADTEVDTTAVVAADTEVDTPASAMAEAILEEDLNAAGKPRSLIFFLKTHLEEAKAENVKGRKRLKALFKACLQALKEYHSERKKKLHVSDSRIYLACFCTSFSMTLAVHFYGTMIAGIFCIGIAAGYCFVIFRKKYFRSVMTAGVLSIMIAVLPMLLAFLGGTRLEGSLRWGMSIIMGGVEEEAAAEEEEEVEAGKEEEAEAGKAEAKPSVAVDLPEAFEWPEAYAPDEPFPMIYMNQPITVFQDEDGNFTAYLTESLDADGNIIEPSSEVQSADENVAVGSSGSQAGDGDIADSSAGSQAQDGAEDQDHIQEAPRESLSVRIARFSERVKNMWNYVSPTLRYSLYANVFRLPDVASARYIIYSFFVLVGLGFFYQLFRRQYCYGAMLASTGFFMLFMCVMMISAYIGLPVLMDFNRGSIYFSYCTPLSLTILADGVLYLPFSLFRNKAARFFSHVLNLLSLAVVFLAMYYTVDIGGMLRQPLNPSGQEMNEAVACLRDIVAGEKDFNWTIVSANDELRMGWDHGYHYETITFLEDMERLEEDTMIRIPTPVVFFFIEKIPIDYDLTGYENSGQSVSEEGADRILPPNSGIGMYQKENRWILMSRMYYWAEEFKKSYPGEMTVYMETDQFLCYRIEQNPYRLYNFAIDYGYNNRYFR